MNTTPVTDNIVQTTSNTQPAIRIPTADEPDYAECNSCGKPCVYDDNGYSHCCKCHVELHPKTRKLVFMRADPTVRAGTGYRGVTRVFRSTLGRFGYRVQITRKRKLYYLGEYDNAETAARVFDNAVYYLMLRRTFFVNSPAPEMNFPADYEFAHLARPQYLIVSRLMRKLDTNDSVSNL